MASVTATLNEEFPAAEGVPDNTPALERFKPVGRLPDDTRNVRGACPPLAVIVWL